MKQLLAFTLIFSSVFLAACAGAGNDPAVWICLERDELEEPDRERIEGFSNGIVKAISEENFSKPAALTHKSLGKSMSGDELAKQYAAIARMLPGIESTETADVRYVKTASGGERRTVMCGCTDKKCPDYLEISTPPGIGNLAFVRYDVPGESLSRNLTLQLSDDDGLKIVGINATVSARDGKNAAYYAELAGRWHDEGKLLSAYLAYSIAMNLSWLAPNAATGEYLEISKAFMNSGIKEKVMGEGPEWRTETGDYRIINISLITTKSDISPVVAYLSHRKVGKETTPDEARILMKYVESNFPELSEEFDAVLFAAYEEMPEDRTREYRNYRHAVPFSGKSAS